ncbi:hypothetical protein AXX16_4568 [Serratia rubidaea]|nr:hypothetical protein [Serratia rubidaea]AML60235.1 hypothetical protein AXX16_4568 [Serratia rubidaea]
MNNDYYSQIITGARRCARQAAVFEANVEPFRPLRGNNNFNHMEML